MQILVELIKESQPFLVKRTLAYAKLYGYVKYTSTLEEAWVASISGLSEAIILAIQTDPQIPEIEVDHDFSNNPISSFGIIEAQKHRYRGVSLEMFLGLMKYYRQAYLDLIADKIQEQDKKQVYLLWINRFFDHNEIAFCSEWAANSREALIIELQDANRKITNEKNKYLTIFESMSTPAIILDTQNRCININYSAQHLLYESLRFPGHVYYSAIQASPKLDEVLPWLSNEFMDFNCSDKLEDTIEKGFVSPTLGKRNLVVKFHRMLDVSSKFEGAIISFADMTEYIKIEEQLRSLSFHDALTGLYNRAYMDEEINRIASGRFNPVGFIAIDVDGLKLVNDNFGHSAGDTLLINVGEILRKCFRECDIVVRNGGDEFAILMPLTGADTVQKACQRIHDKIIEHNNTNLEMPISMSIGWSVGELGSDLNIQAIIKEADNRMYAEKQTNHPKYAALFNELFEKYGTDMQ